MAHPLSSTLLGIAVKKVHKTSIGKAERVLSLTKTQEPDGASHTLELSKQTVWKQGKKSKKSFAVEEGIAGVVSVEDHKVQIVGVSEVVAV